MINSIKTEWKPSTGLKIFMSCAVLFMMFKSQRILWVRHVSEMLICLFAFLIFSYYVVRSGNRLRYIDGGKLYPILIISLAMIYESFWVNDLTLIGILASIITLFCSIILILTSLDTKKFILSFVTKAIQLTIAISIIGWSMFLIGLPLPHYLDTSDPYYTHEIFYLFNLNFSLNQPIPRFAGVFLEPGHLGTMCIFLLFINNFQLKYIGNIILLLGALLSLSLAAYGLLVIAFSIHLINLKKILLLIVFSILFLCGWIISANYNKGDNIMYQLIYHRFEFEDGEMVGNNRTSSYFDSEFSKYCSTDRIITGMGQDAFGSEKNASNNITIGCAGYKRYFFIRGVIGSLLTILFLIIYFWKYRSKYSFGFLIIYVIANFIRDYPLKPIWLYLYIIAVPVLTSQCKNINKKYENRTSLPRS